MPSDVLITPASSKIDFTDGSNTTKRLNISGTAFSFNSNLNVLSSTSLGSAFKAEGVNGTLFEVVDDLSNSLMSVNTIGGLPVFEVFANNSIIAGQYNANDFVILGNKIGLGYANPVNKLSISGSVSIGASYNVAAPSDGLIVQGNVGIGTASPTNGTLQVYNASGNTLSLQKSGGFAALAMGSETTVYTLIESINTGGIRFYTGNGTQTERWKITSAGILESTGAQTIRTSIDSLTLATNAGNGHIILSPHGTGNVGIGTITPGYKLDVNGNGRVGDAFYVTTATTADAKIEIGNGRSGNGNSYIDLVGDATYTDYGLRLIRSNGGANTTSAIAHRGTGTLYITAVDAASISLETSNATRVTINSSGNAGVGTTSPSNRLDSAINVASSNHLGDANVYALAIKNYDATAGNAVGMTFGHGGYNYTNFVASIRTGTGANPKGDLVFGGRPADGSAFTENMRLQAGGNVGIGATNPIGKLQLGADYANDGYGGYDIYVKSTTAGTLSSYDPRVQNTSVFSLLITDS